MRVRIVKVSGCWYAVRYDGTAMYWHDEFERVKRAAIWMAQSRYK